MRLHLRLAALAAACSTVGLALAAAPRRTTAPAKRVPTYHRDVAPILYQNCAWCHHAGEVAPFSLTSYADARDRARQIADITASRAMPPWKADSHGEFCDERKLTDAQIATLREWAAGGAREGTPTEGPAAPKFTNGWQLGKPDEVAQPSRAYQLAADGDDVYRCFVVPTSYNEDRWISAVEVRPGNRKVVHHVLIFVDTNGAGRKLEAADHTGQPGYTSFGGVGFIPSGGIGGWAPGNLPLSVPDNVGMRLPKGADLVVQVHYHKDGKPETDLTKLGIHFAKHPVAKELKYAMVLNPFINIPAGDADYHAHASLPIPRDATVFGVVPHMHLLGREMTVKATLPNGTELPMIKVNDWDFNWQMSYRYKAPLHLPAGSKIQLDARYDNSSGNFRNPNSPPKAVHWGEQTTDEMCIAFIAYTE